MNVCLRIAATVGFVVTFAVPAHGDIARARLIQKAVTSFECSIFAAFMSPTGEAESQRFFQVGYDSAMEFLSAVSAGDVTQEEYETFVRMDVALNLKAVGSTHPAFAVGRLYQHVRDFTGDRVMHGRTSSGAIDFGNVLDLAQSAALAGRLYSQSNCVLID